jgi:biotin transport system substrate-specific component
MRLQTFDLVIVALAAAIMCILAPVSIVLPVSPVPITLGFFATILVGIVLDDQKGMMCVLIYLLLGAVGLPVFSNFTGGLPKLIGPTGGYLFGYFFQVAITGFFVRKWHNKMSMCFVGAFVGSILCYLCGTFWLGIQLNTSFMDALRMAVVPFIPADLIKIIGAVLVGQNVRKALLQQNILKSNT